MIEVSDLLQGSTDEELSSLIGIIHDELLRRRKQAIQDEVDKLPLLTEEEKDLANSCFVQAIKAYRARTALSLADSKPVVITYLTVYEQRLEQGGGHEHDL